MKKEFIFTGMLICLIMSFVELQAGSISPLIRPSNNNIVDLGYKTNSQKPNTVPMIWAQYKAITEMVDNVIVGKSRIYQKKELCISDERLVENCPIDKKDCSPTWQYNRGSAVKQTVDTTKDAVHSDVQTCTDGDHTKCEYYSYTQVADSRTETIAAVPTNHYNYTTPNYSCNANYTMDNNYKGYGYKRCVWKDNNKGQYKTGNKQCYIEYQVDIGWRVRCDNLEDWRRHEAYYVGAVWANGTIENSCHESQYEGYGRYCDTVYRYLDGCTDGFSRVFYGEGNYPNCLKTQSPNVECPYPYSKSGSTCYLYVNTTYSCPTGYEGPSADHKCSRNVRSCPSGWVGPDEDNNCFFDGYDKYNCPGNELIEGSEGNYVCPFAYYYYDYECPDDHNIYNIPWSIVNEGGDCDTCNENGCVCNSATPPAHNCKRKLYICPYDDKRLCTELPKDGKNSFQDIPMIDHDFTGKDFVPGEYGQYREAQCGTQCDFSISKVEGNGDELCFSNRTGDKSCVKAEGCTFDGIVDAGTYNHISSITLEISSDPKSMLFYNNNGSGIGSIQSSCSLNGGVSYPDNGGRIISFIVDGPKLKFWDSYEGRGDVGFLEILDSITPESEAEGFRPAPENTYALRGGYFDRIFYYDKSTYAISATSMDKYLCRAYGDAFDFKLLEKSKVEKSEELEQLLKNYLGASFNGNLTDGTYPEPAQCFGETGWFDGSKYVFYSPEISYSQTEDMCHKIDKSVKHECWIHWKDDCHHDGEWLQFPDWALESENGAVVMLAGSTFQVPLNSDCTYRTEINPKMLASGCGGHQGHKTDTSDLKHSYLFDQVYSGWFKLKLDDREIINDLDEVERPQCKTGYRDRMGMTCNMPAKEQRCVLYRDDDRSFEAAEYARKTLEDYSSYNRYFCSPYVCPDHSCRVADCETGYEGRLINNDLKPLGAGECTAQRCDANRPHYEFCGKYQGCPEQIEGITQNASGKCVRTICNEGGYNPEDKQCYKWQCPIGTSKSGEQCVKN